MQSTSVNVDPRRVQRSPVPGRRTPKVARIIHASAPLAILLCLGATHAAITLSPGSTPSATRPAGSDPLRARLEGIAETVKRNEFAQAEKELEALIGQIEPTGDRALLAQALMQLGFVTNRLAAYDKCLAAYGRAHDAARAEGDRLTEGRALLYMAQVRKNTGDYPAAQRINQEARAVFEAIDNRRWQALSWQLNGSVLDLMGEYSDALGSYDRARALLDEKDSALGRLLNEAGISHKNLGNYAQDAVLYQQALEVHARNDDTYGRAVTLHNLGILDTLLGDYEGALAHYEESLSIARANGDVRGQSILLGNIGEIRRRLGDPVRAVQAVQEQLDIARRHEIRFSRGVALQQLAAIATERGDLAMAREYYDQALELERESGTQGSLPSIYIGLAEIDLKESQPEAARQLAEQALAVSTQSGDPEDEWRAHFALARIARAAKRPGESLRHLQTAVAVVNSVRGRVLTDRGKIGYFDVRQDLYHELVGTLVEQEQPEKSLEMAEAARGRALSDLLAGRLQGRGPDRERIARVRAAEARLRAAANPESRPQARGDSSAAASVVLARTRSAEAALDAELESLRQADRELASLVVADPVSSSEAKATARRLGATIVEYLVTRDRLFAWVIRPSGEVLPARADVPRETLRTTVRTLHDHFDRLDAASLRNPAPVRKLLRSLHEWTVEPIAAWLPKEQGALVYFVPHDALLLVPFAALEDARGQSLVQSYAIATTPSLGVLRYTAAKAAATGNPEKMQVLAFADPVPPAGAAMDRLPGARMEVASISRRLRGNRVHALLGADASEANAKELGGAPAVLHFAVHGLVRDDRPWESALVLSPGDGQDGWLRVEELFALDLQAGLVVLSGCSTGKGRISGDGILGLARALTYAGAPSLLVSQWDVSDVSTAYHMDQFYAHYAAGQSKARALRSAQLATRKRYPHPALWAAFVLVGEAK
jgi:CHAT domain-containing protein